MKSCSNKPDEAWLWLNEVFDNKTPREKLEEKLQEPGKFITLDTKLSAALTRSAKGDLATKIHNFKDEKSKKGIQVRGRRVLLMFEDYFRTSEEAGSLYRVEDLLGVVRTGESVEDLRRFLNRWDATIAGMETPPDDLVLRDILLRQVRKCQLMKYDIEAFDRAPEKSEQKSYAFLLRNIRDLLDRERLRSNRNRIVEKNKQTEKPQPAAPAQGGKKIAAKERVIEVNPVVVARVEKGIRYATNSGMASAKRVKTVPTSISRIPQDLVPPKRRVRAKAVAEVVPPTESRRKRWPRSHALTFNRANVVVVTSVFTNMKLQLHPQRIQNAPIALHQRRRPVQKLRHALLKGMHA